MSKENLKILLINPPLSGLGAYGAYSLPIGLLYLSAVLKKRGFPVKVYDADFQHGPPKIKDESRLEFTLRASLYKENLKSSTIWKEIQKTVEKESPDIVGIGFETSMWESAIKTAKIVKEVNNKTPIIVGGTQPTLMPEETIKIPYFDVVVIGEGELTLLELIIALRKGKDLKNVKGILFKKNRNIAKTLPRPFIKNLDLLPFPAKDTLINEKDYPSYIMGSIISSRGCPYHCAFCCNAIKWKSTVRFRSPQNVVEEIEEVYHRYGTRVFSFKDATLTVDMNRVHEICDLIKKKNLHIVWNCMTRVNLVNEKLVKKMRSAGCYLICFGIESGSQEILNKMKKGITLDQIKKAVNLCKKEGIIVGTSIIIGYPGETRSTIEATLNFLRELDPDIIAPGFATPLPRTHLYETIQEDLLTYDLSSPTFGPTIKLEDMDEEELWEYHERIIKMNHSVKKRFTRLVKSIKLIPVFEEKESMKEKANRLIQLIKL
ncbi:MAG: radical SAM protein [Candidatus Aenigmarchaeota archaeon]|nr:radical SAM protein [Candidatus Aenigmarchaeota archaeon]